jgi:copper(I)-binding protein
MPLKALWLLIIALFISSCDFSPTPALEVKEAWVQAAKISEISTGDLNKSCACDIKPQALSTNAFLSIYNNSATADRLLKAESADITRIEFRESSLVSDLQVPAPLDKIDLPAKSSITFARGNYAMVLMGMKKDLKPGEKITLSLFFEKAGQLDLEVEIREK